MTADTLPGLEPIPASPSYQLTKPKAPRHPYQHLQSTNARGIRTTNCRICRAPIITGVDEDWCAIVVKVDTTPLSAAGELACLLTGRGTYTLDSTPARLTRRRSQRMRQQPPGNPQRPWHKYDVLPLHQCNSPIAENLQIPTMLEYTPPKRSDRNEPPPF